MSRATYDRCRALTEDGERCSRPAQDGEFCYQHDADDPTVEETADESADDGTADAQESETDSADDTQEESQSEADQSAGDDEETAGSGETESELVEIREVVHSTGGEVIGRKLDGIVGMDRHDDGWHVTVEVVERSAVPDTQDIIGQYEIDLGSDHRVNGYRRIDRYRRGDTSREDYIG